MLYCVLNLDAMIGNFNISIDYKRHILFYIIFLIMSSNSKITFIMHII